MVAALVTPSEIAVSLEICVVHNGIKAIVISHLGTMTRTA